MTFYRTTPTDPLNIGRRGCFQPLMQMIGLSRTHLREMPATWHVSTTWPPRTLPSSAPLSSAAPFRAEA
eukprot:3025374-Rhodomonas_salina.2